MTHKSHALTAGEPLSPPGHDLGLLAILSALMSFASISTDLYLPALPDMRDALHVTAGAVEWTISAYLVGFSLGQLIWGPLGDRYGRRRPIMLGVLLFIAGSAGCALSTDVSHLIAWRLVQAAGACASVVLARAMVRDLYSGAQAARMLSTLMTVMAVAPLLGPSLGGLILHLGAWPAIFWVQVAMGGLMLWALRFLPETLPAERRQHAASLPQAWHDYGQLLRQRRLLAYAGLGSFFYAGMFAYVAGTPVAYISHHHVSPQHYGLLFALGIAGIMLSNQLNARLVHRVGMDGLIRVGAWMAALAGGVTLLVSWRDTGGLWGLVTPLLGFLAATGLIVANSIAGAMHCAPARAGAVSALVGALQYGGGILGAGAVGWLADGTPRGMALTMLCAGLGCLAFTLWLHRQARPA